MWADAPWFVSSTMELQVFYGGRIPRKLHSVTINNSELSRFACTGRAPPPLPLVCEVEPQPLNPHNTLFVYSPTPRVSLRTLESFKGISMCMEAATAKSSILFFLKTDVDYSSDISLFTHKY